MTGSKKSRIAVVDDNPGVLEALENLLNSFGYEVRAYSSAIAFLEDDAIKDFDCLISDIGMPFMDGFELQDRVRAERPNMPVILITGRHDLIRGHALAANNRGIFRKPLDAVALVKSVADVLQAPP